MIWSQQMKKELESFGPDFFEEIEDLKYNYKKAVQRCSQLETKLQQVGRQFGVSVSTDFDWWSQQWFLEWHVWT